MSKTKPYVGPIEVVQNQLYELFSHYFSKGCITEREIADRDLRGTGAGLSYVQLRTLLRTECKRRGIPFILVHKRRQAWASSQIITVVNVTVSAKTREFINAATLLGKRSGVTTEGGPQIGRMQEIEISGEERLDAALAVLAQQEFAAKARAIMEEHYPPK